MNLIKKIIGFFSSKETKTASDNKITNEANNTTKSLELIIVNGHMLLIRDNWPIIINGQVLGIVSLVEDFFNGDNEEKRKQILEYIKDNNIVRDDDIDFYNQVLTLRMNFSENLLNFYYQVKSNVKNKEQINNTIDILYGLMYKLSPPEYIDNFSNYLLSNDLLSELNNNSYYKCLTTILEVTFATGNEKLGKLAISKGGDYFKQLEIRHLKSIFSRVERRFGKLNADWINEVIK